MKQFEVVANYQISNGKICMGSMKKFLVEDLDEVEEKVLNTINYFNSETDSGFKVTYMDVSWVDSNGNIVEKVIIGDE